MNPRVVIVTGAFGALGHVVCEAFARAGDQVAAVDVAPAAPDGFAELLGDPSLVLAGRDITNPGTAAGVVGSVLAHLGGVDALVNIAGGFAWETIGEAALATWERLWAINVVTCLNMCHAAAPALAQRQGRIVNLGADGALKAAKGMAAYAAAKSGVHRLTEALAEELKGEVTVNAVLPSIIDTPQNRHDLPSADFSTWVSPAELAAVIAFLASPEASAITGALVPVTGRV